MKYVTIQYTPPADSEVNYALWQELMYCAVDAGATWIKVPEDRVDPAKEILTRFGCTIRDVPPVIKTCAPVTPTKPATVKDSKHKKVSRIIFKVILIILICFNLVPFLITGKIMPLDVVLTIFWTFLLVWHVLSYMKPRK